MPSHTCLSWVRLRHSPPHAPPPCEVAPCHVVCSGAPPLLHRQCAPRSIIFFTIYIHIQDTWVRAGGGGSGQGRAGQGRARGVIQVKPRRHPRHPAGEVWWWMAVRRPSVPEMACGTHGTQTARVTQSNEEQRKMIIKQQ
ncbi:hypothetical protein E2C01_061545 [Portunus trituberculatus]|uniref:Uncharacterized protein n=1 Tax=Portunus trituberculatus TaxID=210409 RepID=A0A5B7H5I1_PORTR|nr:hypothetical protein [Portunus trituberculatus]